MRGAAIQFPQVTPWPIRHVGHVQRSGGSQRSFNQSYPARSGDFSGYRPYSTGDDPRHIDWRATGRCQSPMVRQWEGESRSGMMIMMDVSASLFVEQEGIGSGIRPFDFGLELVTIIAAAALAKQMTVTIELVSNRVEFQAVDLRSRACLSELIRQFGQFQPEDRQTDWFTENPLLCSSRHGHWLFLISDFHWLPDPSLAYLNFAAHRTLGIRVLQTMRQKSLPSSLGVDVESGREVQTSTLPTEPWQQHRLESWCQISGIPILDIATSQPMPERVISSWLQGHHMV
ncbi:MAG: hypothetical protein RJA81_702 [Planctomycetota bacterium]